MTGTLMLETDVQPLPQLCHSKPLLAPLAFLKVPDEASPRNVLKTLVLAKEVKAKLLTLPRA